jgi:hypothetical protein
MKRFSYILSAVFVVASIPLLVLAQFQGPSQSPPNGNVPGVIWNAAGTGVQQTGAQINIDGDVNSDGSVSAKGDITGNDINAGGNLKSAGDVITRTVSTTMETTPNTLFNYNYGNIVLQSGRAFHIDQSGSSTYWMGNWANGSQTPLTFYLNGDLQVSDLNLFPLKQGNRGRVQATQFCFNPGTNPSDCITSWAMNSGLYVQKIGDAMTGPLSIAAPTNVTGLTISGGSIGADLSATTVGLQVYGGNYGAYIAGGGSGYGTWLSYPSYGTYVTVPASSNYGLYVNAAGGLTGAQQSAVYANVPVGTVGLATAGRVEATGDLDVAGNTWGGVNSGDFTGRYQQSVFGAPQWQDYVPANNKCANRVNAIAGGGSYTCPNGTYMGGVQLNANQQVTNLICCTL